VNAELIGTWTVESPEWYQARRSGVTASEIAALMGLSSWMSPFALYWRKLGELPEQADNDAMSLGRHLEPWVADRFAQDHPEFQVCQTGTWRNRERPWQLCNPDRLIWDMDRGRICRGCGKGRGYHAAGCEGIEPLSVLEIKTDASYDGWGESGTDEIPVKYRAQVQWQMDTLGLTEARVSCLFKHTSKVRHYVIPYDPQDVALMREAAVTFLGRLERRDPPPIDHLPPTTSALKALNPKLEDREAQVTDSLARRYRNAVLRRKHAEEREAYYGNRIRAAAGDARTVVDPTGAKVAIRSVYDVAEHVRKAHTVDKLIPRGTT
jgi:putative phage-type endonuclease